MTPKQHALLLGAQTVAEIINKNLKACNPVITLLGLRILEKTTTRCLAASSPAASAEVEELWSFMTDAVEKSCAKAGAGLG